MPDQPPSYDQRRSAYAPPPHDPPHHPPHSPAYDPAYGYGQAQGGPAAAQPPAPFYAGTQTTPPPEQPPFGSLQPPPWEPRPYPYTPPKSRQNLWIFLAAAAVVLISVGAFVYLSMGKEEPEATIQPGTGGQTPAASAPAVTVTLTTPDELGDRERITDAQHTKVAADTAAAIKRDANVRDTVVAYYGTADPKKDKVYIVGAATSAAMPKSAFDETFATMARDAGLGEMSGITDVEPGPLGGYAKCGLIKVEGMPVAACAWADEGSFVTVMWYNRQLTTAIKAEFVRIRGQVETKSS